VIAMNHRALVLISFLVSCTDASTPTPMGSVELQWGLNDTSGVPATCRTHQIDSIAITMTNTTSGKETTKAFACADVMGSLDVAFGIYRIDLAAMGDAGDLAGSGMRMAALSMMDPDLSFLVPVMVKAPKTSSKTTWTLRTNGGVTSCASLGNPSIRITTTAAGKSPQIDLWDCTAPDTTIDVPYGPFTTSAEVLDGNNLPIGLAPQVMVQAVRGVAMTAFTIDVH
jgi:hypothetical protein